MSARYESTCRCGTSVAMEGKDWYWLGPAVRAWEARHSDCPKPQPAEADAPDKSTLLPTRSNADG